MPLCVQGNIYNYNSILHMDGRDVTVRTGRDSVTDLSVAFLSAICFILSASFTTHSFLAFVFFLS